MSLHRAPRDACIGNQMSRRSPTTLRIFASLCEHPVGQIGSDLHRRGRQLWDLATTASASVARGHSEQNLGASLGGQSASAAHATGGSVMRAVYL